MSVNLLGMRKIIQISEATGLPILRAWVLSHSESGRWAYLTIGWDAQHQYHRHAWFDRRTGDLEFDNAGCHNSSCYDMFPKEMT